MKTYRIAGLLKTLSPLSHMMGTSGNESIINRRAVKTNNGVKFIPSITGNSIRHRMIRESGKDFLIKQLGLEGKCTIDILNFMDNGGSLTESSVTDNLKTISELKELFPLYAVLGGSLRNQILSGSLFVSDGYLICEENRTTIEKILPNNFNLPEKQLLSCESFISKYQYTRGDAKKNQRNIDYFNEVEKLNSVQEKSNLMIYNGQSIIEGSYFYHDFIMPNSNELELGAVLNSIKYWQDNYNTLGGSSRVGHGRLFMEIFVEPDEKEFDYYISLYKNHINANKEKCVQWLFDNLGDKPKKESKKKKEIQEESTLL